ncbi:MAG: prepilin peptidase [Leptospiraceae bacterium]|nr:prepilin peptidase [Leptospiraceae bacterium]
MLSIELIFYFYGFLIAASLASFYTTLGERILKYFYSPIRKKYSFSEKWKIIFSKPSACENCNTNIKAISLFPVLGYLFAFGKCKTCGVNVSYHYPLIEFIFGVLFCILFYFTNNLLFSFAFLFLLGHVLVSMITDYKKFSLDYENLPFILFFGVLSNFYLYEQFPDIYDYAVLGGFVGMYVILWIIYPKGIGLGDVIFAPIYAFLCGHPYWIIFLNSSYIFAITWAFLARKKGENIRNKPIPMGFFFGFGILLSFIYKAYILNSKSNFVF